MSSTYWIHFTIYECPVCGRGGEYRERRYDAKPDNPDQRYTFENLYDNCMAY